MLLKRLIMTVLHGTSGDGNCLKIPLDSHRFQNDSTCFGLIFQNADTEFFAPTKPRITGSAVAATAGCGQEDCQGVGFVRWSRVLVLGGCGRAVPSSAGPSGSPTRGHQIGDSVSRADDVFPRGPC